MAPQQAYKAAAKNRPLDCSSRCLASSWDPTATDLV